MGKKAFVLYQDYRAHLDLLKSDADFRLLIEAIFDYADNKDVDTEPMSPSARMAFSFITTTLARDQAKYEKIREIRAAAGSKGGLAKVANAKQNPESNSDAKNIDSQEVLNVKNSDIKPLLTDAEFDAIWSFVPARDGTNNKRDARRCIEARRKEGHTVQEMIDGLVQYSDYCKRAGIINTNITMMMSRFFGRDKYFLTDNEWEKKGHGNTAKKFTSTNVQDILRSKASSLAAETDHNAEIVCGND